MKVHIYTLGCKVNQYESQQMLTLLKNNGYTVAEPNEKADVYIINSCTVTSESSRKTRQAVRKFKKENPDAIIVLTGCFSQAFPEEAEHLKEADIILGNKTSHFIVEKLNEYLKKEKRITFIESHTRFDKYSCGKIDTFDGHTRAFVKIQDGCNRYCTYCIIPKSRGFSRSRSLEDIQSEIERLSLLGYKEIVFVGINLSAYGIDTGKSLCDALEIAENTVGIERIRLGSLEPDHITDEVIDRLAKMKKFCPQFHLSLQSGSDEILKRMNRHYTSEEYYELCQKLKTHFPDISLTTDVIVGFPGESEKNFEETIDFVKKCGFMKVHVFPFSPREGTPAYSYPDKITNDEKNRRCALLQKTCDEIRKEYLLTYIDKSTQVLFESSKGNIQHGYTRNYTPVYVNESENLCGQIKKVRLTQIFSDGCLGILEQD